MSAERPDPEARGLAVLSSERWQRLQDHFARVLGIGLRTSTREKTLLCNPSWPSGFDSLLTTSLLALGEELDELLPLGVDPLRDIRTATTPLGVSFAAIPLRVAAEEVVAYFIVGPVILGKRDTSEEFRRRVTSAEEHPERLWSLLLTIRLYSFSGIRSVLRLLEEVGNALLELAEQARTLQLMIPEVPKIEQSMRDYYLERLLQSLLDVAASATDAEGGSVMLYDAKREALQIRAARGLPDDVIATTRLEPGEGLAGIAVADRVLLVLDEGTEDERLKARMTRTDLVSSLVAPIVPEASAEPIGVLNLRTTNPERRFSQEQIEIIRRLIHLASIALVGLQGAGQERGR